MTSPQTPRHSRHTSSNNVDLSFATPLSYNDPNSKSRRHSKTSIHSPTSVSAHRRSISRTDFMGADLFSSPGGVPPSSGDNGLGNLADELADAWGDEDDEEEEEMDMNFQEGGEVLGEEEEEESEGENRLQRDSGVDVASSPVQGTTLKTANLTPPTINLGRGGGGHKRQPSDYDGSDYGGDSDLDSPGMPAGLVARMDMVESLARRGTENNGTERDNVVLRVIESLKDLGGQSSVEGGATRLATAHTALSTHLLHQTRLLQNLAYPILSPFAIPPDEEFIDSLLPLLLSITDSLPRPSATSFNALTQLHALTADLVSTLNYLSDTLHMSRQTTIMASRRLKTARELVEQMRKEEEEREEGELWLERHRWGERLRDRECARVCGDVVGGFEEVCEGWRRRLVAQAEAVGA